MIPFHRPFSDYPFSNQLLIWATRTWMAGHMSGGASHGLLRDAFRLARAPEAFPALDSFLTLFVCSAERMPDFRPVQSDRMSLQEHRFLCALFLLQTRNEQHMAESFFSVWLPPTGVRLCMAHGTRLADTLRDAGHLIFPLAAADATAATTTKPRQARIAMPRKTQ